MSNTYSEVWDLDVFFEGGSASPEFAAHLKAAGAEIEQFKKEVESWQPADHKSEGSRLESLVGMFDKAARKIRQAGAFVSCLHAQNTNDKKAGQLKAAVTELSASLQTALTILIRSYPVFRILSGVNLSRKDFYRCCVLCLRNDASGQRKGYPRKKSRSSMH